MKVEMEEKDILNGIDLKGEVFFSEPMKKHTTLRIGGNADIFVTPGDIDSLRNILAAARDGHAPVTALGGGSNILVSDNGIEGLTISSVSLNRIDIIEGMNGLLRISAGAGIPLQRLVNISREKGYKGIEGLAGIPGSVGGAVHGNAGAFGYEIGNVIESVTLIGRDCAVSAIKRGDLNFGYRTSDIPGGSIILGADIRLEKDDAVAVAERIRNFHQEKLKKQPISEWSAGCVFKNPAGAHAGRLIEEALCKGMRRGDIEVSSLHANFFVNKGNGNASDFLALMDEVKDKVFRLFGIELEPEIRIIGRGESCC